MLVLSILYWVWTGICLSVVGISNLLVSLVLTKVPEIVQKASEKLEENKTLTEEEKKNVKNAITSGELNTRLNAISLSCATRFAVVVLSALLLTNIVSVEDNAFAVASYILVSIYMLWDNILIAKKSLSLLSVMYIWIAISVIYKFMRDLQIV